MSLEMRMKTKTVVQQEDGRNDILVNFLESVRRRDDLQLYTQINALR